MHIDPSVPLILIPWDQILRDPTHEKHVVILTESMGSALNGFRNNPSQGIIFGISKIEPSCFYDECLTYSDSHMESVYESTQTLLRIKFATFGTQQWLFANRLLLKEFEGFFTPEEVQYLEPLSILKPYTMFISEKDNCLMFSYPKSEESLLCFQ